MSINATLIVQMIAFAIFVLGTMKFIVPMLTRIMDERTRRITEGLAAAERGNKALQEASLRSDEQIRAARGQAQEILGAAGKQAAQIVEEARTQAKREGERIVTAAKADVDRQIAQARDALRKQVGELAVEGASRILKREVNAQAHADVLKELAARI
ncbi:MAG TPA: F0F1 ATP synthase subunit B [Candidatus Binatia bacterium]|nr:F0F1 ATP synthase subunit B [Candidatus Binatia bacterium]